jgi:hypothetical protein
LKNTNDYIELSRDLFYWEDIRTGNEHAKTLCNFLAEKLGLDWLDKADIQKSDRVLEIKGTGPHSVLVSLSTEGKKATVSYMKEEIELPLSKQIAVPQAPYYKLIVHKPRQFIGKTHMNNFMATCTKRVQRLILSIVLDDAIGRDIRKILVQDESFQQILDDTKNQFDEGYKLFE